MTKPFNQFKVRLNFLRIIGIAILMAGAAGLLVSGCSEKKNDQSYDNNFHFSSSDSKSFNDSLKAIQGLKNSYDAEQSFERINNRIPDTSIGKCRCVYRAGEIPPTSCSDSRCGPVTR